MNHKLLKAIEPSLMWIIVFFLMTMRKLKTSWDWSRNVLILDTIKSHSFKARCEFFRVKIHSYIDTNI